MYTNCFINFKQATGSISIPMRFTYPFHYEPHPLCILATEQLQNYLKTQTEWKHDFGIKNNLNDEALGKMFGVLVVQNKNKKLGFLAAYSGKLANRNDHPYFVPPIYNLLDKNGFFKKEEAVITEINHKIKKIENDPCYIKYRNNFYEEKEYFASLLSERKGEFKRDRKQRKFIRGKAKQDFSEKKFKSLFEEHKKVSLDQQHAYKHLTALLQKRLLKSEEKLNFYAAEINVLKAERKNRSAALQQKIFKQFSFLNAKGIKKNLIDLFKDTLQEVPPAGAGECSAPKLLQYAYLNNLKPLAMAEFWWGVSPKSEIRKHTYFYPACKSKCKPILAHMLEGLKVAKNPLLENIAQDRKIEIIYEDEMLLVINKPAGLLSVPGKDIQDSVFLRMQKKYPHASGPLVVHRLDMSTSGVMLIAKTSTAHKFLQYQFINRIIKKRYLALLEGIVPEDKGLIDLPLRVDIDNRPHQLVCYQHGKSAQTRWEIIERSQGRTRIYFYPLTGRTHQLRVHAAHQLGLNIPIAGDELYGKRDKRLYLHADFIEFVHPESKERMIVEVAADF